MPAPEPLSAISLFTGVGGLDFGFEAAGFRTLVAVEQDSVACDTLRLNRRWPLIQKGIQNVTSRAILRAAGLKAGEADVLIGGPPCQPFSKAAYWKHGDARRMKDPRADTLAEYLRVLGDIRPRAFLLENVPGLAFSGKDEGLRHLLRGIGQINKRTGTKYEVACHRLNAAAYGVPQIRERIFLIGFRDGQEFRLPPPTRSPTGSARGKLLPYATAWDAIGDLDADEPDGSLDTGGKWGGLLASVPEGQNYLWHTARGGGVELFGWRTRYWSFLLKLAKNLPSWTIQAQPGPGIGPFHWRNRRLSIQELCRLQTLPATIRFKCGRTEANRLVGNAVPSLLAEVLANQIRRQLVERTRPRKSYRLAIKRRGKPPARQRVLRVPDRYLALSRRFKDHPGEGKGKGAKRQRQLRRRPRR